MTRKNQPARVNTSPYCGAITQEQFLFYEMRTTARLLVESGSDEDVVDRIIAENLYQYPSERSLRKVALGCIRRLRALDDMSLVEVIATQPFDVAKQVCLYAMMKQNRLVCDFMLTVIGEKYRTHDNSFSKADLNAFFLRLQEQDDKVAGWSDSTITKIKQVLKRILLENGYLEKGKEDRLCPVLLHFVLENALRNNGDERILPAFNQFS